MDIQAAGLALYVILLSMMFGGACFERLVLVSVWSSDPPRSVREWNANTRLQIDPSRFFRFVSPPLMLLSPLELYVAWSAPGVGHSALALSAMASIVVLIATLIYYFPTLTRLTHQQGKGLTDAQVVQMARTWVALQWLRLALVAFAWLSALWAFRSAGWAR